MIIIKNLITISTIINNKITTMNSMNTIINNRLIMQKLTIKENSSTRTTSLTNSLKLHPKLETPMKKN
jgi:hypothetical protein